MDADQRAGSVFINCPFDPDYQRLFDALVFTVAYCGFRVRSALELVDSGKVRLAKILKLIEGSKFSIHDISRVQLDAGSGLPRFNMPIELGIAIGMKHLGRNSLRDHCLLVLDAASPTERFRYQQFASDLAGTDIKTHGDDVDTTIKAVRDFLSSHISAPLPGHRAIADALSRFEAILPDMAKAAEQTIADLTFVDRLRHVGIYIARLT